MAVEYKGSEFLYLVYVDDEQKNYRVFNQTDGSSDSAADEIELDTKDKSGSDYGNITYTISFEGIMTEDDVALDYIRKAQRQKKFVKIIEVNTRNNKTEEGMYMITNVGTAKSNGDYATYTIDGALNGSLTEGTITEVPEGAPDTGIESP